MRNFNSQKFLNIDQKFFVILHEEIDSKQWHTSKLKKGSQLIKECKNNTDKEREKREKKRVFWIDHQKSFSF